MNAPVLLGEGFVLRVLELSDAEAWKAGEDPEQIRWFDAPGPAPLENIVNAITTWRSGWANAGPVCQWGIWVEGQLASGVELRVREDGKANISYLVFPFFRRRGLARKATRLAAEWAFKHLRAPTVVVVVDEANTASRGVAEGAGFKLDGFAEPWEYSESGVMLRYVLHQPG